MLQDKKYSIYPQNKLIIKTKNYGALQMCHFIKLRRFCFASFYLLI